MTAYGTPLFYKEDFRVGILDRKYMLAINESLIVYYFFFFREQCGIAYRGFGLGE
jgi:hypothetical protein